MVIIQDLKTKKIKMDNKVIKWNLLKKIYSIDSLNSDEIISGRVKKLFNKTKIDNRIIISTARPRY